MYISRFLSVRTGIIAGLAVLIFAACDLDLSLKGGEKEQPAITGVTVARQVAGLVKGTRTAFTATVYGSGNPDRTITWSVDEPHHADTVFNGKYLTVAAGETAPALTIRATSKADAAQSGTITLPVFALQEELTAYKDDNTADFGPGVIPTVITVTGGGGEALKHALEGLNKEGNYVVNLAGDITLTDETGGIALKPHFSMTISLRGIGNPVITMTGNHRALYIDKGKVILRDLTLRGDSRWVTAAVWHNGTLIMDRGSTISGGISGVRVSTSGRFIMNSGAVITGASPGGGVRMDNELNYTDARTTFIMNGGEIRGNNGTIGGGVFMQGYNLHFEKHSGALIYGHNEWADSNNSLSTSGHAVAVVKQSDENRILYSRSATLWSGESLRITTGPDGDSLVEKAEYW